jgi:bacterioferritin (cytochrome b1)
MITALGENSMKANPSNKATRLLNELLECELSALSTYSQALESLARTRLASELARFKDNHEDAVHILTEQIRSLGGTPITSAGVWSKWPTGRHEAEQFRGLVAQLDALTEKERHSLYRYREVLSDDALDYASREIILDKLLPRTNTHHHRILELLREDD